MVSQDRVGKGRRLKHLSFALQSIRKQNNGDVLLLALEVQEAAASRDSDEPAVDMSTASPYFVHEPSASSVRKNSKVRNDANTVDILCGCVCIS